MEFPSPCESRTGAVAAAVLLWVALCSCWRSAAQTTSTWNGGGTTDNWTDPANWENEPSMEAFPDNNSGGGNFLVQIPRGKVILDDHITISSIDLGVDANEGGLVTGDKNLISEIGALIGAQGGFDGGGGTFTSQGGIDVSGAFLIDDWTVNAQSALAVGVGGGDGSVVLDGDALLFLNQGLEFLRNGDLTSPVGSNALVTNRGEFRRAPSASGLSEIGVNFVDSSGTIETTSGTLKFLSGRTANLTNSTLKVQANGTIQFSGNTTISGSTTIAGSGAGTVFLGGSNADVTLNGTFQNETNAADAPSVVFSGNEFSGGTLNLQAGEGFFHSSGSLGVDGIVINRGRYNWNSGTITGMGLVNENSVVGQTVFSTTTDKIVTSSAVNNMGHITQSGNIRLDVDGKVINSLNATYLLQNAIVNSGQSANTETGFFNQGTIESVGNSQFSARLNSSKDIVVKSGALKLRGPTNLTGTTESPAVVNVSEGANLQIGVSAGSVSNLTNVRFEPSSAVSPPSETKINFVGGASSLSGLIQSQGIGEIVHESGTVRVRTGDSATLQFADSAPFVLKSNPNQASLQVAGSLTNNGALRWESGALTGQGTLLNAEDNGLIEVTGTAHLGNGSSFGSIQNDGVINVVSNSSSAIVLAAGSRIVNRREGLIDFLGGGDLRPASDTDTGSFENSGIIGKLNSGQRTTIDVPFEQTIDGILDVQQGSLQLSDVATLRGSIELDRALGALSAPAVVVDGDSVTEDLTLVYDEGTLNYSGAVAFFQGTVSGTGTNGRLELFSDFTRINGNVTFDLKENTRVQAKTQIEGEGRVTNKGAFELAAGVITLEGSDPPSSDPTLRPFTNQGTFTWSSGTIRSDFENAAMQADGTVPEVKLLFSSDKLLEDHTFYNSGYVRHSSGKLTVNANASIVNERDGVYQISNLSEITAPNGSNPGEFRNRGVLQMRSVSNNAPAQIAIPLVHENAMIAGSVDAKLNITAGYSLQAGKIELTDRAQLSLGPSGSVDGVTIDVASTASVAFSAATLSGVLKGEGEGPATFSAAMVPRLETVFFDLGNARLTGNAKLFGAISNSDSLTIDPGPNAVRLVETDANSVPVGSGGIIRNVEGATLGLRGTDFVHNLASPLAEANWGQIQNDGDLFINRTGSDANVVLNEVLLRNFETGVAASDSVTIAGNGKVENQGRFVAGATTIDALFDNTGVFVAAAGTNQIRNLLQFSDGELTGGTYQVLPGATLLIGSGNLQKNMADVTLAGGTAQFPSLGDLLQNAGDLTYIEEAVYQNTAEFFFNSETGSITLDDASATFNILSFAGGSLTALNNSSLSAEELNIQSGASMRVDDSTIEADEVNNDGTFNIGNSPGSATIDGNYSQTGTLEMEIGGLVPSVDHDLLEITGSAQLGGILEVTGLDLGSYSPAAGDGFTLLTSANPIQGSFDVANYPTSVGGFYVTWDPVDYSNNQVSLEIANVGFLQADFDNDFDVDQDDLTNWQSGYGISASATHMVGDANGDLTVDGSDFLIWQRQLFSGGGSSITATPEPATWITLLMGTAACMCRRF